MEFSEYQDKARKTAKFMKHPITLEGFPTPHNTTNDVIDAMYEYANLSYATLGMVGEAGEVANKVKKIYRDANGEISEEITKTLVGELGDVLWYLSATCTILGVELEDVARENIEKLFSRLERGVISGSGDNR
jgi:NTP pyrophosphatase (non-canonical NTP hydrolase)